MTEREVIAMMTDVLKSVREAIVYTFPPGNLNKELYNNVNLALGVGLDKLNEQPETKNAKTRNSQATRNR